MNIEHAYREMLAAERAFSRSIDNFSTALADDEKVRNHPGRKAWASEVQQFHTPAKWYNLMAKIQRRMIADGVLNND